MASIKVGVALVTLTETTLKQILAAVEQAREEIEFTDDPMPDGDMDTKTYVRERARRGAIRVGSNYGTVAFEILLNKTQMSCESLDYRFRPLED